MGFADIKLAPAGLQADSKHLKSTHRELLNSRMLLEGGMFSSAPL
jgi:hypothetical protein